MLLDTAVSALSNVLFLGFVPLLFYHLYHRWRDPLTVRETFQRVGLQRCEARYLWICAGVALAVVLSLLIFPPSVEPFVREGSAQRRFLGLGLDATSVAMALLYGGIQTGFSEELLFRGLIGGSLSRRLPALWANVVQALIFLLPHVAILFVMPEVASILLLVLAGGLFTGWVRIRSGSILGPWLVHASANVTMALSVAARS